MSEEHRAKARIEMIKKVNELSRVELAGVISGLVILEGRQNFQKEGHIVRFCAIKEGQYGRNFIMKINSAQTRPLKKNFVLGSYAP